MFVCVCVFAVEWPTDTVVHLLKCLFVSLLNNGGQSPNERGNSDSALERLFYSAEHCLMRPGLASNGK